MVKKLLPKNNSRNAAREKGKSRPRVNKNKGAALGPRPPRVRTNEVIERGFPGFKALRYRCKLNYYENVDLNSGAASAGTYVFSANGLYDPNITSTGHQPMPFDQLMLSFDHYCVVGAKMTVTVRNQNTTYPADVAISLNGSSTAITDYTRLVENGLLVRERLNVVSTANSQGTLVMPINVGKFSSCPSLLSNPDMAGSIAANPVEQSYFHLSCWNGYDATVVNCIWEVFIEYDAWFFEPRKNSPSLEATIRKLLISEEREKMRERKL